MNTLDAEWRARFERFGRIYLEAHEISGWSHEGLVRRLRLFEQVVGQMTPAEGARALELGCGAGTYVRYLAALGYSAVGLDYSLPSLGRAVQADLRRNGRYVAGDGYALPFAPRTFDVIVCIGVLQALSQPERLLDEIARVLRPHGVIVVEALNALELPAMMRRGVEFLRNRPPRLRGYSPFRLRRWLEERKIRLVRRVAVYLPPRRWPSLGRILDSPAVMRLLEGVPGGSLVGAHAFWLVGRMP